MFYAVYDKATGELFSTGTDLGDREVIAERGLEVKEYPKLDAHPEGQAWDSERLDFVDVPPPEPVATPVETLAADPEFGALSKAEQALVEKFVGKVATES